MAVGKRTGDQLERLKGNVKTSYDYFKPNFDLFHSFRRFVFKSSLSEEDIDVLKEQQKPQLEFNILEAYISRLRGEFARQQPSISVHAQDGVQVDPNTLRVIEDHFRAILFEANNNSFEYDIYTDLLSGGFSVMKTWSEYSNSMSFDQVLRIGRVDDPTLCGFDVMARYPHKGDGNYSFELFPKTKEEAEQEFNIKIDNMNFSRDMEGFSWSYKNNRQDIVLVGDYYEKKKKKAKIVQLATGQVMTDEDYQQFLARWQEMDILAVPPTASRTRNSEITTICRYQLIENQVLDYSETDLEHLPHIFVDGNSMMIRDGDTGAVQQMTRPYVYHAKDTQRFMNYAGQCWANELENMLQQKWLVPIEGVPEQCKDAYTNAQLPSVVFYKSLNDQNPDKPVQPPTLIQRPPMPPEIQGAFANGFQTVQNILGAYDASLGVNGNDISGKAIIAGSTNSNAAAMPYVVGFMQGLNQAAQCLISMMSKKYDRPRTIPLVSAEGKNSFARINEPGAPQFDFSANSLNVRVEASVNFSVQKDQALQTIIQLSKGDQQFNEFINTMCLDIIMDNLEIRGSDELKDRAKKFQQMKDKQRQAAMKQPNPQVMKAQIDQQRLQLEQQKMMQNAQQSQVDSQLKAAEIANDADSNDIARAKLQADLIETQLDSAVKIDQHQTEKMRTAIDAGLAVADQKHRHLKEATELHHSAIELSHNMRQANKKETQKNSE